MPPKSYNGYYIKDVKRHVRGIKLTKKLRKMYKIETDEDALNFLIPILQGKITNKSASGILAWHDVEKHVKIIVTQMEKASFHPDFIYMEGAYGGIIGPLIMRYIDSTGEAEEKMLISVGMLRHMKSEEATMQGFDAINLNVNEKDNMLGTYVYISNNLPLSSTCKILVVTDYSGSGVYLNSVVEYFSNKYNIQRANIKTASLAYMKTHRRFPAPDFYGRSCDGDIWFPWGKSY